MTKDKRFSEKTTELMFYKYLSFVKGEHNKYETLIRLSLNKGKIKRFPFQFQGGPSKMKLFSVIALIVAAFLIMVPGSFAKVIVLFDENAASEAGAGDFVAPFASHDAGSTVTVVTSTAFMGKSSLLVTAQQSYNNIIPNWKFPIDETPYMTFAWKKDGGKIIMIQLAYDQTWAYRYHCGDNTAPAWPSTELDKVAPADWKMYTRDLTKDFAKGWNLTGLAFTPWDGGGYYDFILLHSDPNPPTTAVESAGKIATTWGDMKR
jgi:hypothetical protein